jgi:hypothetical protein
MEEEKMDIQPSNLVTPTADGKEDSYPDFFKALVTTIDLIFTTSTL